MGRSLERETLEALLDERLGRREVKDIQSGFKDPDRFDKWIAILSDRVEWDDPIVLPMGEALYLVRRRSDGELVEGELDEEDCAIECPRHGSRFDLRTGKPLNLPAYVPVDTFPVSVEDGVIRVEVD